MITITIRLRDINNIKSNIEQFEKYIANGKEEIKEQYNKMNRATVNIDSLKSELVNAQSDFDRAKQNIIDYEKQLNEDTTTLNELNIKLNVMRGMTEYVRPSCKSRPETETTLI